MGISWRTTALACAVIAVQSSAAWAEDVADPSVSVGGVSNTDIAIGRGGVTPAAGIDVKPFPDQAPPSGDDREIGAENASSLRREISPEITGTNTLPEAIAAVRNEPDPSDGNDEAEAPVTEWTHQLDAEGLPSLAPPPKRKAPGTPPEAMPGDMGSRAAP